MKTKDPTVEQISNGCLWILFALGSMMATAVVAGYQCEFSWQLAGWDRMKPKDNTKIPHGLIVCDRPLTPELAAELKRILEAELARPTKYFTTAFVTSGDRASRLLIRDRKALWFIAGIGTGTLMAAAAFVVLVLWMV